MTGNKDLFSTYESFNGGNVVFGNSKSKIIGKGTISNKYLTINDVCHVENLNFNLLSIGQICDKKCNVLFTETGNKILKNGITIGRGIRKHGVYVIKIGNEPKDKLCLTSMDDTSTLSLVQKRDLVTRGRNKTATHSHICMAEGTKIDNIY